MRLVNLAKDGAVELNWMWLPTFIGQNYLVLKELEKIWRQNFNKAPRTNETLDAISDFTVRWLCDKFKIPGLDKYLEGLKYVMEGMEQPSEES
jgi:hypothetical protein